MNFPPFWALGRHGDFSCWRWSHESLAAARALAEKAAQELAARFTGGRFPSRARDYYGVERPPREPVIQEFRSSAGELAAVVTRNSLGCLVLNTARMMFVDVDAPAPAPPAGGFFQRLFSRGKASAATEPGPWEADCVERASAWVDRRPEWGWRIYRTKAGLRLLATHALGDPAGAETEAVFEAMGADPLYRRLCKVQQCFRARLTPKHWRCGLEKPPGRWPYASASEAERWERRYTAASESYATCKLVATLGNQAVHPEIHPLLIAHDLTSKATSNLPLA